MNNLFYGLAIAYRAFYIPIKSGILAFLKMKLTQLVIVMVLVVTSISFSSMVNEIEIIEFIGSVVNSTCNTQSSLNIQSIDFYRIFRRLVKLKFEDFDIKGCDFVNFDKDTKHQLICG